MKEYPKVVIEKFEKHNNQYTRESDKWSVSRLIQFAKEKEYPTINLPLCCIDLGVMPWTCDTIHKFIYEAKRIEETDLSEPILLDDTGFIADGWHRVCAAILKGHSTIKAIRLNEMPNPDNL